MFNFGNFDSDSIPSQESSLKFKDFNVFHPEFPRLIALDEEDGNLTHKIVVKENEVNVSKAGSYKVTYEVTDSMYETTTKSINVTVESNGNIINYELFAKIGGVLLIILIIGSLVSIVIRNKKK